MFPKNNGFDASNPQVYYYTGPPGPPGPFGPPGRPGNLNDTAISFTYAQLAYVIEQIIKYYPTTEVGVYTIGFAFTFAGLGGTPVELYASPDGSYGGLFVIREGTNTGAVPLQAIASISLGAGVAYNPAICYISKPTFPPGFDNNVITAVHDYLTVGTAVTIFTGGAVSVTGVVYKNVYGMLVIADDMTGVNATFVPVTNLTGIMQPPITAKAGKSAVASHLVLTYKNE